MGGTISIVNEGQTFMGFSKMNVKNEENSEDEDNKNNKTDFYYLEKEKSIEESLASKEFELNKTEYFRDKIVEEAEYWVDNLSYFKDNLIKTQKLDKSNPPPYMDEDDFADFLVKSKFNSDSSTGLGQIFAKTALESDGNSSPTKPELKEMWEKLQNDDTNILYVGKVLKYKEKTISKKDNKLIKNAKDKEKIKLMKTFKGYNGSGPKAEEYGKEVYNYFIIFKDYNKKVKEVNQYEQKDSILV